MVRMELAIQSLLLQQSITLRRMGEIGQVMRASDGNLSVTLNQNRRNGSLKIKNQFKPQLKHELNH